jgi:hypothetical protein
VVRVPGATPKRDARVRKGADQHNGMTDSRPAWSGRRNEKVRPTELAPGASPYAVGDRRALAKELVAEFWISQVRSMEEALAPLGTSAQY